MDRPAEEVRQAGDRIEQLFDELQRTATGPVLEVAEELLRSVSTLYAAGLGRMVDLARTDAPRLIDRFVDDELVASLLLAAGIHPRTLADRVEEGLARVRPVLGAHGGDVELLAVDPDAGAVRLHLLGSCDGCPSSAVTLQSAVEQAILDAAPDVTRIEVDVPQDRTDPVPVSLGTKPRYEACPTEMVGT